MQRITMYISLFGVFLCIAGCQTAPHTPFHFYTDAVKPLSLKVPSLIWQWNDDALDIEKWPSAKAYLENAICAGLVPTSGEGPALVVQVKGLKWTERPETPDSSETSLFRAEPGHVYRIDYEISVGDADTHGFQKRALQVQLYDEITIPRYTPLADRQQKFHELGQHSCERLVKILQERIRLRFSDLVIEPGDATELR